MAMDDVPEHEGPVVPDLDVEDHIRIRQIDLDALVLVGGEDGGTGLAAHIHARIALGSLPAGLHGEGLPLREPGQRILCCQGADVLHLRRGLLDHGYRRDAEDLPDRCHRTVGILRLDVESRTLPVDDGFDAVLHQHVHRIVAELVLEPPPDGGALQSDLRISRQYYRHISSPQSSNAQATR